MKKFVFLLLIILCFSGCNKVEKESKNISKVTYEVKKDYYVSVVPLVNHDDYYDNFIEISNESNFKNILQEKETIKEDIISFEDESVVNINSIIEQNNEIKDDKKSEEIDSITKLQDSNYENNNDSLDDSIENSIERDNDSLDDSIENSIESDNDSLDDSIENKIESDKTLELEQNQDIKVNTYYNEEEKNIRKEKVKVVDVSYYQGIINWEKFVRESDCYGVILRLGYYKTLDKMFEKNISELKRLGIAYGIYLFSYSTTLNGSKIESDFTNEMIDKYNLEPTLGIYYDIEQWSTKNDSSNNISKSMYDEMVQLYINSVSSHVLYKYKVKVYSGRWYAMNRLGDIAKSHVDWVAEYNSTCKYDGAYSMWQYTSKGSVPGINGNVDLSYLY